MSTQQCESSGDIELVEALLKNKTFTVIGMENGMENVANGHVVM